MGEPRDERPAAAPPPGVASRLVELGTLYVPEADVDVRRRLTSEQPSATEPFAKAVARRLEELRALCELTSHLHRR